MTIASRPLHFELNFRENDARAAPAHRNLQQAEPMIQHQQRVSGKCMIRIVSIASILAFCASMVPASSAVAPTFAVSYVQAAPPHGAPGRDAGVDLSAGGYVRLSASGSFVSRTGLCGTSVGPFQASLGALRDNRFITATGPPERLRDPDWRFSR